jgi:branched-subunit amino acid transport protein
VNINMLLVTLGMVLATFMTRAGLLLVGQRFKLSPRVEAALRYAPVCALAVLIVPQVVVQAGTVNMSLANPRLAGALAATAFFLWKRSMVGCIVVGMLIVVTFRWL